MQEASEPLLFVSSQPTWLGVAGVLYDIVGAVILARGLVFTRARSILKQASSGWGFSSTLVSVFSEQKIDAATGLVVLQTGFLLQGLSAYGWNCSRTGFLVLIALLVVVVAAYYLARKRLTKLLFFAAIREHRERDKPNEQSISDDKIEELWKKYS